MVVVFRPALVLTARFLWNNLGYRNAFVLLGVHLGFCR